MTKGRFWLFVSALVAGVCGAAGPLALRETGELPAGSGWSMAASVGLAVVGWLVFVAALTLSGR